MNTILEEFLDVLEIRYTKHFAIALYQEHPHKYNMYGLQKMLNVYGVKTIGVRVDTKDLLRLNYPCILHTHGDFVIGLDCNTDMIKFLQQGKETTLPHDFFQQTWTGNALVVKETTEAVEPDYRMHQRLELVSMVKTYSTPVMLMMAVGIGIANHLKNMGVSDIIYIVLSLLGVFVCILLIEKQLFGSSRYGDRVCSLFHHADCNSILDGPQAKIFGISWSEVGLGYFSANTFLLSLFPFSFRFIAAINWLSMFFGLWSIYYQWRVAKSWCMLCIMVQTIIWAMGITAVILCATTALPTFDIADCLLSILVFAAGIMTVHQFVSARVTEEQRIHIVQRYRALKANDVVAKNLIESGDYYETTLDDSSVIFGNPKAKIRVTILSNPHCNPCSRMHQQVESLLASSKNEICIQYIFSSFNKEMEDSNRYLIFCYKSNSKDEALRKFALWYEKEKFNYERVLQKNYNLIHTETIEKEMEKHRVWRKRTALSATPTVLVNGHKIPSEYELIDLAMVVNTVISEKKILQDINGRSTTPLGAEQQTAE